MVPQQDAVFGDVTFAQVVLTDEKVPITVKGEKRTCCVSDHYGLVVDIDMRAPGGVPVASQSMQAPGGTAMTRTSASDVYVQLAST